MVDFEKIRELAAARKVSIKEVEEATGLANGTIGKWRRANPTLTSMEKVASYFDTTVDALIAE